MSITVVLANGAFVQKWQAKDSPIIKNGILTFTDAQIQTPVSIIIGGGSVYWW